MHIKTIVGNLEEIANASGNSKIPEIEKLLIEQGWDGYMTLFYSYNPFITFGIDNTSFLDDVESAPNHSYSREITMPYLWNLLEKLRERILTGNEAKLAVEVFVKNSPIFAKDLIVRILKKDLRAGIGLSSINKAIKNFKEAHTEDEEVQLIPEFDTMLAHKYAKKKLKATKKYRVEPKLDGMRALIKVSNGKAEVLSRNGKPIPAVQWVGDLIASKLTGAGVNDGIYADTVYFDGEFLSGDSFNDTMSGVKKKSEVDKEAVFFMFDILTQKEFEGSKYGEPLLKRVARIDFIYPYLADKAIQTVQGVMVEATSIDLLDESIDEFYELARAKGLEGCIVKDLDAIYEPKRSFAWMKIKGEETEDLTVIGYKEGTGKYEGMLGSLNVDYKGVAVDVGSGLTDEDRAWMWTIKEQLPGKIAEVQFHEVTPDGSLRHPRFIRFRGDKE